MNDPVRERMYRTRYLAEEVTPPRCTKCNEPVSLNKRDCRCTREAKREKKSPKKTR